MLVSFIVVGIGGGFTDSSCEFNWAYRLSNLVCVSVMMFFLVWISASVDVALAEIVAKLPCAIANCLVVASMINSKSTV